MSDHYAKVWGSLLDSSVWTTQDLPTKVVWITLLAMADSDGRVHAAVPGIAARAGVSVEECDRALEIFQKPDVYSRSQEYEGRKIERDGRDWVLLNYGKFRTMVAREEERRRKREWWQEHKAQSDDKSVTNKGEVSQLDELDIGIRYEVLKPIPVAAPKKPRGNPVVNAILASYVETAKADSPQLVISPSAGVFVNLNKLVKAGLTEEDGCRLARIFAKDPPGWMKDRNQTTVEFLHRGIVAIQERERNWGRE